MKQLRCPYCEHEKPAAAVRDFTSCKLCGFKSALVEAGSQPLLIVDREMPYLRRRCDELAAKMPGVRIVVDRRIVQDELGKIERRLSQHERPAGSGPFSPRSPRAST